MTEVNKEVGTGSYLTQKTQALASPCFKTGILNHSDVKMNLSFFFPFNFNKVS